MSYNPANYPIVDSNVLRGSLLMTFDNPNNDPSAFYTVSVNSELRDQEIVNTNDLFSTFLYVGDVVTVTIFGGGTSEYLNVIRTDFTTDSVYGDSGISTINVDSVSGIDTVTFTATTVNTSYNFEYRVGLGTLTPPTPTPTPSITPTISLTPSITPTISLTPSITPTNTPTPSITSSPGTSPTPTPSITPTISLSPSITPTNTITPSITPSITPTNTITPSITPSITPTNTVTPSITATPGLSPTPTPSITPSQTLVYVTWSYDEIGPSSNEGYLYVYLNDVLTYTLSKPGVTFQGNNIPIGTVIKNVLRVLDPSTTTYGGELKSYVNSTLDNFVYTQAGDPANTYITGATYTVTSGVVLEFTGFVGNRAVPLTPTPTSTPFKSPTPTTTPTQTPSITPSITPTNTRTPTVTPTNTITPSPTTTTTPTSTQTPSVTPTLTPTNTQTPSVTPTLTPTPTITPTNLIPVTLQYRYIGSSTIANTKNIGTLTFSLDSISYSRPNFGFVSTTNTTVTVGTVYINSGSYPITNITRRMCKSTNAGFLVSKTIKVYNSATLLYTQSFGTSVVPVCPTFNTETLATTSNLTINPGDTIIVEWTDNFN